MTTDIFYPAFIRMSGAVKEQLTMAVLGASLIASSIAF